MKKLFTATAFLLLSTIAFSQTPVPSYPEGGIKPGEQQVEAKLVFGESIVLSPNPVSHPDLEVNIIAINVNIFSYHVFNGMGQIVEIENLAGRPDPMFFKLPDGTLPGIYYVRFETDSGNVTRKLMVN